MAPRPPSRPIPGKTIDPIASSLVTDPEGLVGYGDDDDEDPDVDHTDDGVLGVEDDDTVGVDEDDDDRRG